MRRLAVAALFAALSTLVAALSLRAADATMALLAIAALTVLVAWFAGQYSTTDESGLALANPAWSIALALVGRCDSTRLLPLIAAQVLGAAAGGLGALGLAGQFGDTLIWSDPSVAATVVVVLVVGIVGTWLVFAVDSRLDEPYVAIPTLLAGTALPVSMAATLNPAVALGLAMADLVSWDVATAAAVTALVAAVAAAYSVNVISPTA